MLLTTILTELFEKLLTIYLLIENYKEKSNTVAIISIYSIKMRVEAFRRIIRTLKYLLVAYHCQALQSSL